MNKDRLRDLGLILALMVLLATAALSIQGVRSTADGTARVGCGLGIHIKSNPTEEP